MARFAYKAFDPAGKLRSGDLLAASESEAYRQLQDDNLVPVEIWAGQGAVPQPWWARDISLNGRQLGLQPTATMARGLVALLRAGLPLRDALDLAASVAGKAPRKVLSDWSAGISKGQTSGETLALMAGRLPAGFIALAALGEQTNTLPDSLERAATHLSRAAKRAEGIRAALIYPGLLLVLSLFLLALLVFFLAPALAPIFAASGMELPGILNALTQTGTFLRANGTMLGLSLFGALLALLASWQNPRLRALRQAILLRLPVIGQQLVLRDIGAFTAAGALMLDAGTTFQTAVETAAKSLRLQRYQSAAAAATEAMMRGESFATRFCVAPGLPKTVAPLFDVAERANAWPDILRELGHSIDLDLEQTNQRLVKALTPILTLIIGGVIALLVLSVVDAMLKINDLAFQ